jgi:hypothetical protein
MESDAGAHLKDDATLNEMVQEAKIYSSTPGVKVGSVRVWVQSLLRTTRLKELLKQ